VSAATHAPDAVLDVAVVEEHLARYAVSCPLCKAVGRMAVAHEICAIDGRDHGDTISVVLVVCKRCGYLMPLAADRLSPPTTLAAA
jgi:hypothetical protein